MEHLEIYEIMLDLSKSWSGYSGDIMTRGYFTLFNSSFREFFTKVSFCLNDETGMFSIHCKRDSKIRDSKINAGIFEEYAVQEIPWRKLLAVFNDSKDIHQLRQGLQELVTESRRASGEVSLSWEAEEKFKIWKTHLPIPHG